MIPRNFASFSFVSLRLDQRFAKISEALRAEGYATAVVYGQEPHGAPLTQHFDLALKIPQSASDFLNLLKGLPGQSILLNWDVAGPHFSSIAHCGKKIVLDLKDVLPGHVKGLRAEDDEAWATNLRTILHSVHGVCCRDFQFSSYLRNKCEFKGLPRIFFPDYCWPRTFLPRWPTDERSRYVNKIALTGNFTIERDKPNNAAYGLLLVINKLIGLGFEIEHFPMNHGSANLADYTALAERSAGAYRIMNRVPPIELLQHLSRRHFGIIPIQGYHFPELETSTRYSKSYVRWGSGARIFDYFSAGLPVYQSPGPASSYAIEKASLGGKLPNRFQDLRSQLDACYDQNRANVLSARDGYLNIQEHIDKLQIFIDTVVSSVKIINPPSGW